MDAAAASLHELTLGGLAKLLGISPMVLYRLERAGLLRPDRVDADGERRYSDRQYGRLRLYLGLIEAGATMAELRTASRMHDGGPTASRVASRLIAVFDALLRRLQTRIDRLRSVRADLISAREALMRCHACHRPVAALACRTCRAMPDPLPRSVDTFFCPEDQGASMEKTSNPDVGERLDVRHMPPRLRHPTIFARWKALDAGTSFTLCNDHDPKPLYYQFEALHAGEFDWEYLEDGPEVWRVRIGRTGGGA
jgi:uncharacterized protein (DUF2249 family)/DNA-binding transcriptional MerR regulator